MSEGILMSEGPWPGEKLAREMEADADRVMGSVHGFADLGHHIKALLGRVRELEADLRNQRKRRNELAKEMQVMQEQLDVACDRSESWKNLCTRYKELAEARGEKIDMERDFERERK